MFRRTTRLVFFAWVLSGVLPQAAWSGQIPASPPRDAPILSLDEVKIGQKGFGYTVFTGTQPEPFEVEILGVLHNYLGPQLHLVVARLSGEKIEYTGVIAGMSGSPVYLDGKLLGAVGYAFSAFPKEILAGITPASAMNVLPVGSGSNPRMAASGPGAAFGPHQPISTPLVVGGFDPEVVNFFAPKLKEIGFEVLTAGGVDSATVPADAAAGMVPGGAVAAMLVSGDMVMGATGTITDVRNGKLLAFGHRFTAIGDVQIPMASANIIRVVSSQERSYKLADIGPVVGTFTQDRVVGIGGVVGQVPQMVPVSVTIDDGFEPRQVSFNVFREIGRTPQVFAMALANTLVRRVGARLGGTMTITGQIDLPGHPPVTFADVYATQSGDMTLMAALRSAALVAGVWDNPFTAPPPLRVAVSVTIRPEARLDTVEKVTLDRMSAKPGQDVVAAVTIRTLDGPVYSVPVRLTLPRGIDDGVISVYAGSATAAELVEIKNGPRLSLTTLKNYLAYINGLRDSRYLYVQLVAERPSVGLATSVLQSVPPSFALRAIGDSGKESGVSGRSIIWEERIATPGMLSGGAVTEVSVVR